MITSISRRYRFCASHRLHVNSLSEPENDRLYGKCNNPYGHGHDYVLDVSVTGELNATTGLIIRLADLDELVTERVLNHFDYRNLNSDVAEFKWMVPTTENVASVVANRLASRWRENFPYSSAWLSCISIHETDRNSFQILIPKPVSATHKEEMNESVIVNA